jgi:hypothetical protein
MALPPYEEDRAVIDYVFRYHGNLMTELEHKIDATFQLVQKASHLAPDSPLRRKLEEFWSPTENPDIAQGMAKGVDAFRRDTAQRILCEHAVPVLRCSECQRVLRTPRARQCFYCGLSWHRPSKS